MSDAPFAHDVSDPERAVLGDGLHCDDALGFRWQAQNDVPMATVMARINARNEAVLRSLAMLEEHDESAADDVERAEFHRLEGKVNLVLELLSELVRQQHPGPPQIAMRFSAEGVCWHAPSAFRDGELLLTEWYLLPAWPVALTLYARVAHSRRGPDGHLVCARIEGASDSTRDWLEKLVFRRHRRAIAQQRVTRREDPAAAGDPPPETK
jgi:hypothetical protein